jgi:hypothetical protein
MKYFTKAKTLDEAKAMYKKLAMANHPDKGGETAVMQEINNDFEMIFRVLKHTVKTETTNNETAQGYRTQFYTENGWQGDRYDSSLYTTDLTKIFRDYVKMVYPTFKFRVFKTSYSSIHICLMEAPVNMFKEIADIPVVDQWGQDSDHLKRAAEKKHVDFHGENKSLTDYANKIMSDVRDFVNSYNRDDSDSQTDYFDRRFYENLSIGTWDKPFQIVEKIARITPTKESGKTRIA